MKKIIALFLLVIPIGYSYSSDLDFNIVGQAKTEATIFNIVGSTGKAPPTPVITITPKEEPCHPNKPEGEGWQWDANNRTWWRYLTNQAVPSPAYNVQPYYYPQRFYIPRMSGGSRGCGSGG